VSHRLKELHVFITKRYFAMERIGLGIVWWAFENNIGSVEISFSSVFIEDHFGPRINSGNEGSSDTFGERTLKRL
jgi:hypothetical protein